MKTSDVIKVGLLLIVVGLVVNLAFAAFVAAGNKRITDFKEQCFKNNGTILGAGTGFLSEKLQVTHLCISKENGIIDAMER